MNKQHKKPEEFAEEIDASIEANAADYFGTNE